MYKEEDNTRKEGQRRHNCLITQCNQKGRIVGRLGENILLTYCPRHRKRGERILNFMINSLMRYKLTNFLQDSKQALFMKNEPKLCEHCQQNIAAFITEKIQELEDLEKTMPLDEVDPKASEELDDDE